LSWEKSLSHFQLGESGGRKFSSSRSERARSRIADPAYPRALQMFIDEENEHARLLSKLCERYRVPLTQEHWTHFFFHHIRQVAGIDFELIVLVHRRADRQRLTTKLFVAHVTDVPLQQAARLILRDESDARGVPPGPARRRDRPPRPNRPAGLRIVC